jgi:hypothetical protein
MIDERMVDYARGYGPAIIRSAGIDAPVRYLSFSKCQSYTCCKIYQLILVQALAISFHKRLQETSHAN